MTKAEFQAYLIYSALKEEKMKTKNLPMKQCPTCKGKGETTITVNGDKVKVDCGTCDGTGEVPDYNAKKDKD